MTDNQLIIPIHAALTKTDILLTEVIEDFLKLKNNVSTRRAYRNDLMAFEKHLQLPSLLKMKQLSSARLIDVTYDFINSAAKREAHSQRITNPNTVNRRAYAISSLFQYLMQAYDFTYNPVTHFNHLTVPKKSSTTSLLRAEASEVLKFLRTRASKSENEAYHRDYLMVVCLSVFALRRAELVGLRWSDINSNNQSMTVIQKGGSTKLLPIAANIMNLLINFKDSYPSTSDYIFRPTRNNLTKVLDKPLDAGYLYKVIKRIIKQVLPDNTNITPHSFRKTFIELAINNKEDFVAICNATGHTSINMIGYYCTTDTLKHNAVNRMSQMI